VFDEEAQGAPKKRVWFHESVKDVTWVKTRPTPAKLFGVGVSVEEIRAYEQAKRDLMTRLGVTNCL
jgi:hypothetical protein